MLPLQKIRTHAHPAPRTPQFCEGRPLAEKPNLESLLRCRWAPAAAFAPLFVLRVARGLAGALEHMHYRGVCHGDV